MTIQEEAEGLAQACDTLTDLMLVIPGLDTARCAEVLRQLAQGADTLMGTDPEVQREAFETHWRKLRGSKKAGRELERHPAQPQVYVQDSANRHWVTWQAAQESHT